MKQRKWMDKVAGCIIGLAALSPWAMAAEDPAVRQVIPAKTDVPPDVMQRINEETRAPFKYGVVIKGAGGNKVDCPSVFRQGDLWYMTYIEYDGSGYLTHIASSPDLLAWKPLGVILKRSENGWDAQNAAGYIALQDYQWGGSYAYQPFDGKYWLTYIGGALPGYETDPLSIGLAWSTDPTKAAEWDRLPKPILTPSDPDARYFEKLTLYKSNVIWDKTKTIGHPFVMYYNCKTITGYERIGMAVSDDMINWTRYGYEPVIDNGRGISGDPQITRIGDVWVMFYFGAFYKPGAFDTFACSYDLVHWTKWEGEPQIRPSMAYDHEYAHKPWVVKYDGVVYHFYCAVGKEGRVIALATSKDLRKP
jgi:predicted GH43/DUF377 family glycosyl hydrolase